MKPHSFSFRLRVCIFIVPTLTFVLNASRAEAQSLGPDTVRFLEQSTFGPTYNLIAHVQDIGLQAFLDEQAAAPGESSPST